MSTPAIPAVIDAEHARFLEGPVSVIVASRNAANEPELVRAQGCRVARNRRHVRLFLASAQASRLLDDVRQNGLVAVVFTEPGTHRSLQLKGEAARVLRPRADEAARIDAYRDAMVVQLARSGVSEALTRALLAPVGVVVALEFVPTHAYVQTPGPGAGRPLKVES
ncbi:pyridoxamine 5'-phosphate oxidase family protein [Frateuria soli]|uniref:pyridoxamine 5'-phosphate oxidase family protein n=1 Tax=Frateuria soli TaxID=1542730 RepID=UPI001E3CBD62|nr:pyridoxamine 5'-phosphate oxidase family protein [Frateuria soli]UGB38319.1 pyridoxamine 5'-phosphate oxidase family protein [Frateuria soli]